MLIIINLNCCENSIYVHLKELFQNDYTNSNSHSSFNYIHESDSDISINTDYNEKSSSQHVNNSIISQLVPQVTYEVNGSEVFSVIVDTQTNPYSLIQHDKPVHVCDIEMSAAAQL